MSCYILPSLRTLQLSTLEEPTYIRGPPLFQPFFNHLVLGGIASQLVNLTFYDTLHSHDQVFAILSSFISLRSLGVMDLQRLWPGSGTCFKNLALNHLVEGRKALHCLRLYSPKNLTFLLSSDFQKSFLMPDILELPRAARAEVKIKDSGASKIHLHYFDTVERIVPSQDANYINCDEALDYLHVCIPAFSPCAGYVDNCIGSFRREAMAYP